MALVIKVTTNGPSREEINESSLKEVRGVSQKWGISIDQVDASVLSRVPEVVIEQVQRKLKNLGISWSPDDLVASVAVSIPGLSLIDTPVEKIEDMFEENGWVWADVGIAPSVLGDHGDDIESLTDEVQRNIDEGFKVATFYVVGAISVLTKKG